MLMPGSVEVVGDFLQKQVQLTVRDEPYCAFRGATISSSLPLHDTPNRLAVLKEAGEDIGPRCPS
jgi:hypothetical protein